MAEPVLRQAQDERQDAYGDLGPSGPSRVQVYARANRAYRLLAMAIDLSLPGHREDVRRALRLIDEARAILGQDWQ